MPDPSGADATLRFLIYPTIVLVMGLIAKGLTDYRQVRLEQVRLVIVLIAELRHMNESYASNCAAFVGAYDNGSPQSNLATSVAADPRYYPYIVTADSTLSLFGGDPTPAKSFSFLRSEALIPLCKYHDACWLLNDSLVDLRETAFIELPGPRKLLVFGSIVRMYSDVQTAYGPCLTELEIELKRLTSWSVVWRLLFPLRSVLQR